MSKYIIGIHDFSQEWARLIAGSGKTAWCVATHELGLDSNDRGCNYSDVLNQGITPIIRLNWSHNGKGTIPTPDRYAEFAQRCAAWVAASKGVEWLTIGNEIAHHHEWPTDQPISLASYVDCYRQVYTAIKAVAPHVKIAPQAVAPWNTSTPDAPDWILQLRHMLLALDGMVDWINLHAYTRGYAPNSFIAGATMDAPWGHHYSGWETLYEFMAAIPSAMTHLPVMVTEANGNTPWSQYRAGWVQELYQQIEAWNAKPGHQQIRCACLFRWARHDSQWDMSQCTQAHDDLRAALVKGYQWRETQPQVLPAPQAWTGYVTAANGLRLRTEPSTAGNVLTTIVLGEQVTVAEKRGDWLAATYGALSGWVSAQWVSEQKPTINDNSTVDQRSDWEKAIDFVLRWEGGLANHSADPGGLTNYGISQAAYPDLDIASLTREQAVEIYRSDYWQRSGADKMAWPLCLVHLDSAVNAGVGKAQKWLAESNGDAMRYMALRLDFYTRLNTWQHFGLAWSRRVAELMKEASG